MKKEILNVIQHRNPPIQVQSADGLVGTLDAGSRQRKQGKDQYLLQFDPGVRLWLDLDRLVLREDGSLYLPLEIKSGSDIRTLANPSSDSIAIIEERIAIGKRKVQTGKIRVRKRVTEKKEVIDEPGYQEEVDIERVPVNRIVDEQVAVRQEGETTIIPIMEEILVVEKRLMLKEEVRVTVKRKVTRHSQEVSLRREEPLIERVEPDDSPDAGE